MHTARTLEHLPGVGQRHAFAFSQPVSPGTADVGCYEYDSPRVCRVGDVDRIMHPPLSTSCISARLLPHNKQLFFLLTETAYGCRSYSND